MNYRFFSNGKLFLIIAGFVSSVSFAQIPAGYYDLADPSNSSTLRQTLHDIIDDHQRFPYTSSSTDTWDVLELADQNLDNSTTIISIYKNASYSKQGGGNSYYNREHVWPKSYGFPNDGSSNYPYTDMHHLFLADSNYNSSRSNKPFADCNSGCSQKSTELNNGRGNSGSNSANWTAGSYAQGSWETWNGRKGDVARAIFYMAIRYEGGSHGITNYSEPDLILTDDRNLIDSSRTGSNASVGYMGLKSTLLQWHQLDPVDDIERQHNNVVYQYQGNRNPFVDHPEFVTCVFENNCSSNGGGDNGGGDNGGDNGGGDNGGGDNGGGDNGGGDNGGSPSPTGHPWINEFHYDNSGSDQNEFIEVAGQSGLDLTGYKLIGYNGNGGKTYKTVSLSGVIGDQQNGLGTKAVSFSGLQNGAPDGIALVDSQDSVIQFISYEGSFVAQNGPAHGLTSENIGVKETSSTSSNQSLQLKGSGQAYSDFYWQSPTTASSGNVNSGQSFN